MTKPITPNLSSDETNLIKWLLEGDVSIQYQVHRDLLGLDKRSLRNRIAKEGMGKGVFISSPKRRILG